MEVVYITEEELEYYTNPNILSEENDMMTDALSDEEFNQLLSSGKWHSLEEFSARIDEVISEKYRMI